MEREQSSDRDITVPAVKKTKLSYKFCPHCCKEVSKKIYKEHKRLFYDSTKKIWTKEQLMLHNDDESCTSDFSSLDEFDLAGSHLEKVSGRTDQDQPCEFSDLENEENDPIPINHWDAESTNCKWY